MTKFLRRTLAALLIVVGLLTTAVVVAAVQMFDGKGEWHTSDAETEQMAKARAQQRAQLDAQKKAGVYLKTFSRSVNLELVDDEISAVTNNIIEIVGDVHFDKKIIPLSDNQTTILYTATLKAKIDPEGIYDWVRRDEQNKVTIVEQNTHLQDAIQKNDELAASLTEQYNRATSQGERDKIRKQMNQADRDFLANQKFQEANKLFFGDRHSNSFQISKETVERLIKLYTEGLELNPNDAKAYFNRDTHYSMLEQYNKAIEDYDKAIQLEPDTFAFYYNRGIVCDDLERYEQAVQDYTKAIELNSE